MPDFNENPSTETLVIAFTMVTVSGMATALGAALIFCPCVRPPLAETERGKGGGLKMQPWQKMVLAFSLSLSAGVMTYVSFVEIFQKAVGAFTESGAVSTEDGKDVVYAHALHLWCRSRPARAAASRRACPERAAHSSGSRF